MKLILENWNKLLKEWDAPEDEPVLDALATELTSDKRHIKDVDGYAMDVMAPEAVTFEGFKAWLEENPEYVPLSAEYPAQGTPVTARWADAAPAWWVKER